MTEKPNNITVNKRTREFSITWDGGHVSAYPFGLLRAACPCASCRGGHENMRAEPDASVFDQQLEDSPATRVSNVKAVGSYAVTVLWEDGHDYGIYNWHYLRALCPCQKIGPSTADLRRPKDFGDPFISAFPPWWNARPMGPSRRRCG